MVLMPEPIFAAVETVQHGPAAPGLLVMLTPGGRRLDQNLVRELAQHKRLVLLCGRYEGFDERVRLGLQAVRGVRSATSSATAARCPPWSLIDTLIRQVPGVLGDENSLTEESHAAPGMVEYPQYTRPRVFRGMEVPEVLLSGNHEDIARWRQQQMEERSTGRGLVKGEGEPQS